MKRPLVTMIAITAGVFVFYRLARSIQLLQSALVRMQKEMVNQRSRADAAERQVARLADQGAAPPAAGRGVVAGGGFVSVEALAAEAGAAAARLDAEADAQALDDQMVENALPLAEVEVLQAESAHATAAGADDLTRVTGIGPVFAGRLAEQGITTFAALAQTSEDALADVVQAPAWRQPDFTAWIAQARRLAENPIP